MRLLHYDEQKRFVLRDFTGKTTPPYAILSHRWSDSEVLFEDIASGEYKERQEGYRKLLFCAQRAALDGLSYFWIDTCCIDKWNLRERSKAINSMFQWYRNSTRCYVFLTDVSISAAIEISQRNDWEASFRASTWFTRGWTLQELIAPVSVEFFSCEENRIGDKTSLNELIHDITKIPSAVLGNCPLGDFTTSERRRWVQNRTTTEEEDIVYCLLGILGVSMPTAYGEGWESAQTRLLAEIEAGANVPSIIPFSQNHHFVGQESQLAELEAKLFSNDQTTTTLAIVGAGGTGKSQLALEVAHRTRQNNKSCSVFWIDARDKDSLFQSYSNIAQKLSIPGWDDEHADMKRIIQRCVAKMSERQCVLIFDNAEHTTVQYIGASTAEATGLTDCLPQSKLCSAIFTTTEYNVAKALASQGIIALQHLTQDSALKMLQTRLARPLSEADQWEAKQLLEELWYLPLAVMQAVAYMNASCMTVQEYRSRLAEHKKTAIQLSSDLFEGGIGEFLAKASVTATLLLSLIQVQHNNPLAADYLFFIACVDQRDIPLDLLEAVSSREREYAIRVLEEYALVTRRPADSALDIHRLVHQALQKQLQALGQFEKWTQNAVATLSRVFPRNAHSSRSKWRRLLPHAQYAVSHSPTDDDDKNRLDLMFKCSWTLYNEGRHEEAEVLQAQVMQARMRLLGDDHPDTLISMNSLVLTYKDQGRWDEAEELQIKELERTRLVFGADDPQTLASMGNLATIYHRQGRLKEAEELETYVMEEFKIIYRGDYLSKLTSMCNLGIIYVDQGRLEEAEDLQIEAVKGLKRLFGEDHPETLTAMGNLATTYCKQSRVKQAEELQIQVLHTRSRVLGDEHPGTLLSMHNLAVTLQKQYRYTEAFALMEKCAQMRQQILGKHHPSTLFSLDHVNRWRAPG